jgi:hypothetical protein
LSALCALLHSVKARHQEAPDQWRATARRRCLGAEQKSELSILEVVLRADGQRLLVEG